MRKHFCRPKKYGCKKHAADTENAQYISAVEKTDDARISNKTQTNTNKTKRQKHTKQKHTKNTNNTKIQTKRKRKQKRNPIFQALLAHVMITVYLV